MTRAERLISQLKKEPLERSGEIRFTEGDLRVRLTHTDWDRLGCLLECFELQDTRSVRRAIEPVRIAEKITYLGETLKLIEADEGKGRAILRSAPPCAREGGVSFFEVVVDRVRGLSLTRQNFDRQRGERHRIPAPLTRHALERLLIDLVDVVSPE